MNPAWVALLEQVMRQAPRIFAVFFVVPIVIETKKGSKKEKEAEPKTGGRGD